MFSTGTPVGPRRFHRAAETSPATAYGFNNILLECPLCTHQERRLCNCDRRWPRPPDMGVVVLRAAVAFAGGDGLGWLLYAACSTNQLEPLKY
jgi:hypothetical protein